MGEEISHIGRVISAGPEKTIVRIVSESACASCRAAGLCTAAEAREKDIEVDSVPGENFKPGDEVEVILKESLGLKAVLYAFVIPLAVLVIVGAVLSYVMDNELEAGLISLLCVAVYYLVLKLFRKKLESGYKFYIRRK
jgi:sigma-E factor negative regulatory protein RseC